MDRRIVRFLLVEDNDDHAELIMQVFRENRVSNVVERVPDGLSALRYLRGEGEFSGRVLPDVVLLDVNLPGKNGLEVLEELKADSALKMLPVVILSTSSEESDRFRAYENYVNSYLIKPVDFAQFHQMVQDLKLYWGIWNQSA